MNEEKLLLTLGETKDVFVTNRGSRGLQLVFTIQDPTLINVSSEGSSPGTFPVNSIKPGDSTLACFKIRGLAKGICKLTFSEKKVGMPASENLLVKEITVEVK